MACDSHTNVKCQVSDRNRKFKLSKLEKYKQALPSLELIEWGVVFVKTKQDKTNTLLNISVQEDIRQIK
jgi:hypothetical protein